MPLVNKRSLHVEVFLYPERVINSSKASTSVMFTAASDSTILPPTFCIRQYIYTKAGQKMKKITPDIIAWVV